MFVFHVAVKAAYK